MIVSQRHKYKFKKEVLQVHYFSPDGRGGVVLIGLRGLARDAMYHYNQHSQLLFEHAFDGLVDSCGILHPKEALVL